MELCNTKYAYVQINRINAKTNADVIVIVNRDEDQRIQQGQEVWGGGVKEMVKEINQTNDEQTLLPTQMADNIAEQL